MKIISKTIAVLLVSLFIVNLQSQQKGLQSISSRDLKTHMEFLASDELEGRNTGESGLQIAARYLAVQASRIGLKPVDPDGGFFQRFILQERSYDRKNSVITITEDSAGISNTQPFYILPSVENKNILIEGDVVFAGYGIRDKNHDYNDFENIDISGKVVLIMNRAPMNEEGTEILFDPEKWSGIMNLQFKLPYIMSQDPKAVLVVMDPKSGLSSIEEIYPGIARYLSSTRKLKTGEQEAVPEGYRPKSVFIHRSVADQLLEGSGKTMEELQVEIDGKLEPQSFELDHKNIRIELQMEVKDMALSNVFGLIEGSDPELKDEVVIYVAHYDHVGTDGKGGVFNGADDNASGTVALIEIAEAYMAEKKLPGRSIGILWVSAEEVGLYGSEYFAKHPLVPEEQIVAVINLDMVGRTRTEEDTRLGRHDMTIVGGDTVKVIGGLQSTVLMEISKKTLDELEMVGNYRYNNIDDPERYFFRSDHINFARMDIPVLFYSTGTHRDYHTVNDVEERIDYDKFLKMARLGFNVGYNISRYKGPIEVDNPMSGW